MNTTIKCEDLDRGAVDFSEVVSGRRLPLVHPGEILRDEFLTPMKCSVYRLARYPQRACQPRACESWSPFRQRTTSSFDGELRST